MAKGHGRMIHRINSEGLPSRTVAPRQQRAKGAYIVLWFRDCQRLSPLKNPKESAKESAKESSVCSAEEYDGIRSSPYICDHTRVGLGMRALRPITPHYGHIPPPSLT
jgi:hypothetical protein